MPVYFHNPGEADIRALTTMGLNAKEGDNPIGFFGTGFKYALATALRLGGSVNLWIGLKHYEFTKRTEMVRGQNFNFIYMNDEALHITTNLGRTWEPWKVVREFYCNALDESGDMGNTSVFPAEGTTLLRLTGSQFMDIYDERSLYFLSPELKPIGSFEDADVFKENPGRIYFRGILVGRFRQPCLFSYNLRKRIELSEDREIKHLWSVETTLGTAVVQIHDSAYCRKLVTTQNSYEKDEFIYSSECVWSPQLIAVMEELFRDSPRSIADKFYSMWMNKFNIKPKVETFELNSVQQLMLDKAVKVVKELGEDPTRYNIIFAKNLGEGVLGSAEKDDNTIYIAEAAFRLGTKVVAGTLYEETLHLRHNVRDHSRALQELLLNKIFDLYEVIEGQPI